MINAFLANPIVIAIIVGSVLIAGAILFVFRWDMVFGNGVVYRFDRWTGQPSICLLRTGGETFIIRCGSK